MVKNVKSKDTFRCIDLLVLETMNPTFLGLFNVKVVNI